jgi:hypothetical protein
MSIEVKKLTVVEARNALEGGPLFQLLKVLGIAQEVLRTAAQAEDMLPALDKVIVSKREHVGAVEVECATREAAAQARARDAEHTAAKVEAAASERIARATAAAEEAERLAAMAADRKRIIDEALDTAQAALAGARRAR